MADNLPSGETIIEQLNWRYAVKKFDAGQKISDEKWNTLEHSLLLAPSSYGLQPFKFIVVTDEKIKQELAPAAYGQTQIADCSHLVVIAYKKVLTDADVAHYVDRIVEVPQRAARIVQRLRRHNEGFGAKSVERRLYRNVEFASGVYRARIFARNGGTFGS